MAWHWWYGKTIRGGLVKCCLPCQMSLFLIYQENGYCHQYRDSTTKLLPYTNFYLKVFAQIEVLTTFLYTTSTSQHVACLVRCHSARYQENGYCHQYQYLQYQTSCLLPEPVLERESGCLQMFIFSLKRSPIRRGLKIENVKTNNLWLMSEDICK